MPLNTLFISYQKMEDQMTFSQLDIKYNGKADGKKKKNLVQHANLKYLPEIFVIETSQNLPRNPIKIIWIDQSIRAFHAINPVYLSQPLHGIFFNKQLESRAKETIRIQRTRITGWLKKQISKNR